MSNHVNTWRRPDRAQQSGRSKDQTIVESAAGRADSTRKANAPVSGLCSLTYPTTKRRRSDVPLGHKHASWSFPHFSTITFLVADAPGQDEIPVVMTIADGGRLRNWCGTETIRYE